MIKRYLPRSVIVISILIILFSAATLSSSIYSQFDREAGPPDHFLVIQIVLSALGMALGIGIIFKQRWAAHVSLLRIPL